MSKKERTLELGKKMIEDTMATFWAFRYQAENSDEFDDAIFLASLSALICALMETAVKKINELGPETNGKILLETIIRRVLDKMED